MLTEKALALVVRGTDWSETSRITTLFTREFGKLHALAKGGRRVNSKFDVAFDLLTVCQIVFIRKEHGGLNLLTEARMEQRFPILRQNLDALYAGYYIAELLAEGTQDFDPHPPLFDATLATLSRLGCSLEATREAVMAFELVWLQELGYSPRLDACASCGATLTESVAFSPQLGGALCSACASSAHDRRPLSRAACEALQQIAAVSGTSVSPGISPVIHGELRGLLSQWVSFVLGRRPRLMGYIEGRPLPG